MTNSKTLILGGVRSGKSRLAERLARESKLPVTYIATATRLDEEMRQRIMLHQERRPAAWKVIEEPIKLAKVLTTHAKPGCFIIVDCLTLWITNLLTDKDTTIFESERTALLSIISTVPGNIVLVSNETNMGVTPLGILSRRYCDEAGILHQELAQKCQQVALIIAGIPLMIKGNLNEQSDYS